MKLKSSRRLFIPLLCSSLYAQASGESQVDELERKLDAISMQTVWGNSGAKTAPAIANPDGCGLYLLGEYLYWRPYESNLFNFTSCRHDIIRYINQNTSSFPLPTLSVEDNKTIVKQVTLKQTKFDFDSGYRVGIGYAAKGYEYWDLRAEFSQLDTHASRTDCSPNPSPFAQPCPPAFLYPSADPSIAEELVGIIDAQTATVLSETKVHLDYTNVDVTLGRYFFVSRHLAMRPHWGGRASWFDQDRSVRIETIGQATGIGGTDITGGLGYLAFVNSVGKFEFGEQQNSLLCISGSKNDFWGVGPLVGIENKWFLSDRFNLYGIASASLLFGKFKVEEPLFIEITNLDTLPAKFPSKFESTLGKFGDKFGSKFTPQTYTDFSNSITQTFEYTNFELVPVMRIGVGLSFDYPFANKNCYASVRVGYEANYYWRQVYFSSPSTVIPPVIPDQDTLFEKFTGPFAGKFSKFDRFLGEYVSTGGVPVSIAPDKFQPGTNFLQDSSQKIVAPNSPGDLAFHGLVVGANFGF